MIKNVLNTLRSRERKPEAVQIEEMDSISDAVVECVKKFVQKGETIRLSDNIELDLGIDSLRRIELTAELERAFSVDLPETFMVDVQTVSDLCDKIKEVEHGGEAVREEPKTFRDVLMKKPDESQIRTIGFKQGTVKSLFVWSVLKTIKLFYRIYFGSKIQGVENIPDSPFILVANHASYLDGFLIGSHIHFSTYRNLFFQGAQKYFEGWFLRCFAHLGHVIPIDPDAYLASAFSLSAHVLNREKSLCIFPEGGRSFDGSVMAFRKGIGILAYECRVPLVPVRIHGTYDAMPRGRTLPKRKRIRLVIGEPITVEKMDEIKRAGGDHYQVIADVARQRVMDL
jgi:long-chain acyl-CoA synthetase